MYGVTFAFDICLDRAIKFNCDSAEILTKKIKSKHKVEAVGSSLCSTTEFAKVARVRFVTPGHLIRSHIYFSLSPSLMKCIHICIRVQLSVRFDREVFRGTYRHEIAVVDSRTEICSSAVSRNIPQTLFTPCPRCTR